MFSQVSICTQVGGSLVPCPFWGWVSLVPGPYKGVRGSVCPGVGVFGSGWVCPGAGTSGVGGYVQGWIPTLLDMRSQGGGGYPPPPPDMEPGIPRDIVGKQVVCILLECFLVQSANSEGNCNYINLHI